MKVVTTIIAIMLLFSIAFASAEELEKKEITPEIPLEKEIPLATSTEKETSPNKFSLELDQISEQSDSLENKFKISLKSYYFQNSKATEKEKFTISFYSENLTGQLSKQSVELAPGEMQTIDLKIIAEKPGDYKFIVEAEDENGDKSAAEGHLEIRDSTTQPLKSFSLDLAPEKQLSEDGSATFKVISAQKCDDNCDSFSAPAEYSLRFVSEQDEITGDFVKGSTGKLKAGQKLTFPLQVKAEKEGTYIFQVIMTVNNQEISASGLLVYKITPAKQNIPTTVPMYFEGEGFALKEDHSAGTLVSLKLLENNNEIRGKIDFGEKSYALKGAAQDSKLSLNLYDTEKEGFQNSVGNLNANLNEYDSFSLVDGQVNYNSGAIWNLNVLGKTTDQRIVIDSNQSSNKTINKNEIITIKDESAQNQEVYIVPESIETGKIFGFIPNPWGNKQLKVKLVENGKVQEEIVNEFGTQKIGNYQVSVGSLKDEKSIDLNVEKIKE